MKCSIFSSRFPLKTSPPHSFSYIKFIYNKVTVYWFQLLSLNSSPLCLALNVLFHFHNLVTQGTSFYCQIRLYWHHTTIILFYCQFLFSSCSNSRSWSQHQICDASFFYFTITVLRYVKLYVFRLFVVVSTSSVVWSQVR